MTFLDIIRTYSVCLFPSFVTVSVYLQVLFMICFPVAPIISLMPNLPSAAVSDEKTKIGLSESSGKKSALFMSIEFDPCTLCPKCNK